MLWHLFWIPAYLRLPACLALCATGAMLGWGRLGGRPADRHLADALLFYLRNHRLRRRRRHWAELVPLPLQPMSAAPPLATGFEVERQDA